MKKKRNEIKSVKFTSQCYSYWMQLLGVHLEEGLKIFLLYCLLNNT